MEREAGEGGSVGQAGARLDAALDPARLRANQERDEATRADEVMPWQRRGVVAEEPSQWGLGKGALKWWVILILAAAPTGIVLASMLAIQGGRVSLRSMLWAVAAFGVLASLMLMTNWTVARAKRTGEPYAPAWMWLVPAAGIAAGLAGVMLGVVPLLWMPAGVIAVMSCSGGLLFPMRKRRGFGLHCGKCDYPYSYTDPAGLAAPDVCSECGAMWHERGGLARGSKVKQSPWRLGIYLAVVFGVVGMTALRRPALNIMPTGTLIQMVTQPRAGFTMDEWGELATRTLSQRQRERLATGLLDLRLKTGGPTREADAWLDGEVRAGRLPEAIVTRYHGEMFEGRLEVEVGGRRVAPNGGVVRARVGEAVVVRLESAARITPFTVRDVLVAFEGFEWSGREGVWVGRRDMLASGMFFGRRAAMVVGASGEDSPQTEALFEQPGRYRVRAAYWVVFMPQFAQPAPVTWGAEGLVPPAGALHVERIEVEMWVEVGGG